MNVAKRMGPTKSALSRASLYGIAFVFLSSSVICQAQENVLVYGQIDDLETRSFLAYVQVEVVQIGDTINVRLHRSDSLGRFRLELPYDTRVWLKFQLQGYVTKIIEFDLHGVRQGQRKGGHGMELKMGLLERFDGLNYTAIEEEPFALIHFNRSRSYLTPDMAWTDRKRQAEERMIEFHAALRKASSGEGR